MKKQLIFTCKLIALAILIGLNVGVLAAEKSTLEVKSDSLRQLQDLRTQNVKRLQELDTAIDKKFEDPKIAGNLEKEVATLKSEKHEHVLRQEFLDRLIFQLDTKYNGGDLRAFLERALIEMAKVDATNASAGDGLWKFLKYSADAIHRLPEQKENILAFLEGYMNLSVSNPVLPEEYMATRNYTNGSQSESGRPLKREEVGAFADRRLRQIETEKSQAAPIQQTR